MKKRNLIIIVAVVLIGIVALIVALRGSRTATFKQDYHVADTTTITKLFLADKNGNQVLLQRNTNAKSDTLWTVDGQYPASQPLVDLLLETLNTMRIRQKVNKNAAPNIIKDLAASNVKVEVYQQLYRIDWFGGKVRLLPHEKLTVTYFVGHETQDMLGSFMLRKGDKEPYIIHIPGFRGYITPHFIAEPIKWRSHRIVDLNVNQIKEVSLEITDSPEQSFAIHRDGEGFAMELLHPRQPVNGFDTVRVAQLLSAFTNLNFDEYVAIVPNAERDSTFSRAPRTVLRITDTENRSHELKTYIKYNNPDDIMAMPDTAMYEMFDLDRLYAVVDNKDTVLIQYFVFDNILQPASFFLGQSKTNFAKQ